MTVGRAGVDSVLVPILAAIEVAVGLTGKASKPLRDPGFIAADEGVNPVCREVMVAMLGIEQVEDERVARGEDKGAVVCVFAL